MATVANLRIPDLKAPVLNNAQRDALAVAEATSFDLSVDGVLSAAVERTSLQDFGPDDFRERLELLVSVVAWEGHTRLAQLSTFRRMVNKATDRLLTRELVKQHPEIRDEPINAPLIVAGLPRSSTTHLLNLIAADSRFQSTPYWQVLRPVPLMPEDEPGQDGIDPRWQRAQASWEQLQRMNPYAAAHHPMDPDHISEDGELQMADFSSYVWEFSTRAPDWRDYYLSHDQTPHYEYEKLMMQVLQWQRGERGRWIVKAPQHFEQLRPIMNVFPDAVVIFTHRDPVASMQSILQAYSYTARYRERVLDLPYYLEYWSDRYGRLLDGYLRDVGVVPARQQFDVLFHEFVGNDVPTVERIYEQIGLEMTDQARGELEHFMLSHQRGAHGRLTFNLRGDFDADPNLIRERYCAYVDRVPVSIEVA
jgi:sulfotransferase family protein